MRPGDPATVAVVVLGYGHEPWLAQCIAAILTQGEVLRECVLVDNGVEGSGCDDLPIDARLRVVRPHDNLGFAEGCNEGVRHTDSLVVAFVNSDAVLEPGALEALAAVLRDESVGLVTASVRLGDRPELVNAAGNPMHYLGYTWAGSMGEPAADHAVAGEVTCISGATFAVRRTVWDELGGFDAEYFAYGEDVDLSIRTWQSGRTVRFEPAAVSLHHYEFGRNPSKWFLLERGRLINALTLYEPRTRRYVYPMLAAVELGSLVPASVQGWGGSKVAAWKWVWQHREYLAERRIRVAKARRIPDSQILPKLSARVDPPPAFGQSVPAIANTVLEGYWGWAMRRLSPGPRR